MSTPRFVLRRVLEMTEALPRILIAAAVVLSAYFIFEGVTRLLRSDLEASEFQTAQSRPTSDAAPAKERALDARDDSPRTASDSKRGPLGPPRAESRPALTSSPPPAPPPQPPIQTTNESRQAGPCEADLRVAGAAYLRGSAGDPLVLFSGADVRKGLRSIGSHVAGKTVVAIYPTAVVLREPSGRECWVKMTSAHAREVAGAERRANVRAAQDRYRKEQREKSIARRKARMANRKKR